MTNDTKRLREILEYLCSRMVVGITHEISLRVIMDSDIPKAIKEIQELYGKLVEPMSKKQILELLKEHRPMCDDNQLADALVGKLSTPRLSKGHKCPWCKATTCYQHYECNGCETFAENFEPRLMEECPECAKLMCACANSIAEGVGIIVGRVLNDRVRYGGWGDWNWHREAKAIKD